MAGIPRLTTGSTCRTRRAGGGSTSRGSLVSRSPGRSSAPSARIRAKRGCPPGRVGPGCKCALFSPGSSRLESVCGRGLLPRERGVVGCRNSLGTVPLRKAAQGVHERPDRLRPSAISDQLPLLVREPLCRVDLGPFRIGFQREPNADGMRARCNLRQVQLPVGELARARSTPVNGTLIAFPPSDSYLVENFTVAAIRRAVHFSLEPLSL